MEEPAGWTPPREAARAAGQPGTPPDDSKPGSWHPRRHRPGRWAGRDPLRRAKEDRLVGGVAAAIAGRIGRDVTTVRIVLVVAAVLSGGFVAAAYVVAWMLIPMAGHQHGIAGKAMTDRRGLALIAAFWSGLIMVRVLASVFHATGLSSLLWPLAIAGAGLVLIWRNAPEDEQAMIRRQVQPLLGLTTGSRRAGLVLRLTVALILLGGGIGALQSAHENVALLRPLAGVALLISAIVVLLGPWWLRIARDLVVERQARVRAEERADIAARVHDSVLQTLALIQRRADQPQQVVALARAQERELRSWLFDGRPPGSIDEATTLAGGVRLIQQEVEAQHGIAVEVVLVGDCPLDGDLAALLAAAREATVNAAKWSGASVISIFAEVEPAEVSVYVRDRGQGFDPAAVPADRKGVAESIRGRVARHGGKATIRSTPGEGTEVSLTMPHTVSQPTQA
ncbi:MAG TPA: PspC domain-containing protein [Streptosporangiaceae bacterium]|nr:PspC domain-containing protein [Streptosporangiaceae bacterium]